MLPNFLIIGAMKAGTTSLYSYLRTHPDIFMPVNKEPAFFSNEPVWKKGGDWYESLFAGQECTKARGEASVNYTKYPHYQNVPRRIHSLVPNMKLIYVLRSPIDRIYSHYLHNVYAGIETDPIEKALSERPLYVQISRYYQQIDQYLQIFDRKQLMVIILDDMQHDPAAVVKRVFSFLDVDDSHVPPNINEKKHTTSDKRGQDNKLMKLFRKTPFYHYLADKMPSNLKTMGSHLLKTPIEKPMPMPEELKAQIKLELALDMEQLADFLGRDLAPWAR